MRFRSWTQIYAENPVMFVVELGFVLTLIMTILPTAFGDSAQAVAQQHLRLYNGIVCGILFVTVLFANFAESVAEGRGKAQAASLKKTKQDTKSCLIQEDGSECTVSASQLKRGDVVLVRAGGDPKRRRSDRRPCVGG